MALSPGSRLGPYEVNARIGEGGMGEIYRATDTDLKRAVALKILPDSFATDPDRLARFQREAEVLASLNHPNIAAIYGLERSTTTSAIVMELAEGPTLAERIEEVASHRPQGSSHKGLPLDEALAIARQIADALEAAHEQGIIHRDLKPANVKVRDDGTVKVLDFGLAKALEPGSVGIDATASPTITSPATMTGVGVILGTAAYMSPEQARGKAVDKRTDIWAFGCVLYEMLTGTRAFDGDDVADTLANVLKVDPDWTRLTEEVPPLIRALVRNCLEKDRRKRVSDAGAIQFALMHAAMPAQWQTTPAVTRPPERAMWRRVVLPAVTLVLVATLAGAGTWFATRAPAPRAIRTTLTLPDKAELTIDGFDRDLAIAPDGARIVYAGANGTQLFVRALDALEPVPLAALKGGAQGIFVSPDGQWVGYVEENTNLKKVAITGGPPVTLLKMDGNSRGLTWAANDTIVFASVGPGGLHSVSASGGAATMLTRPDAAHGEADHLWPEVLPGGRHVLYTITAMGGRFELDSAQVAVFDLLTGSSKVLVRGGHAAHYVASGHLVYAAGGTLRAVGFDLDRLEVRGTAVPVVPRLLTTGVGAADFAVAADGTLVYVDAPGRGLSASRTLLWVDRQGREERINVPPRAYTYAQLSPDGTRVALDIRDQENDIWIWDLSRETLQRLTFDPGLNRGPVWAPDGKHLAFSRQMDGAEEVWWQAADGSGMSEPLTASSAGSRVPEAFSPDGQTVVFSHSGAPFDLWFARVPAASPTAGTPLLASPANEASASVSPNGRWLAYSSDESGRYEIYVRPFPAVTSGRWQISTGGGTRPRWSRDGRELFYTLQSQTSLTVITVMVGEGSAFSAGAPTMLFEGDYLAPAGGAGVYDVSSDGKRFLMIKNAGASSNAPPPPPQLIVVQHFDEELKRLAPAR